MFLSRLLTGSMTAHLVVGSFLHVYYRKGPKRAIGDPLFLSVQYHVLSFRVCMLFVFC